MEITSSYGAASRRLDCGIKAHYSFKGKRELYLSSPLALPESLNFDNYTAAFKKLNLGTTFVNTLFYTVTSVVILALLCGMTA